MNNGLIYLIGGANYLKRDSLKVDKDIISSTGKTKPVVLFIGAANADKKSMKDNFKGYYESLGAVVIFLDLYLNNCSNEQIIDLFCRADIIYFSGGLTIRLLEISLKYDLKSKILMSLNAGKIIVGVSAGAILLCFSGYTDNLAYQYGQEMLNFGYLKALNFVPIVFCPHYQVPGKTSFNDFIKCTNLAGYALDDGAALKIEKEYCFVIKNKGLSAYRFLNYNGHILEALREGIKYQILN